MANINRVKTSAGGGGLNDFFAKVFYNPDVIARQTAGLEGDDLAQAQKLFQSAQQDPLGLGKLKIDGTEVANTGLGTTAQLGWNKIKAHPVKTALAGGLGAMNVAGLLDNPYWGGQLIGTGAGIAAPMLLGKLGLNLGGYGRVMSAMGGGFLGSLFDKLRANQAEQNQYQGQY